MNSILYVLNTIVKILIASISIYIFLALVTFLFNWRNDINLIDGTLNIYRNQNGIRTYGNVLGLIVAHSLTFKGFGIASFLFSFTLFKIAIKLFLEREINVLKTCKNLIFGLISISTFLALFSYYLPKVFYGKIGYTINYYLIDILGTTLTAIFIAVFFIFYLIFTYNGGKFFFKANEDNSRTTIPNNNESTQNEKSDLLYDNIEKTGKEKFEFIKNDSEEMISEPIDSRSKSSAKMPVKKEINEFESEVVENNILDTETVIQINIETGQLINSDRYLEYILPVPDLLEINIKKRGKESGDLNQTKIEILKLFNAFNIPAKITAIIESKRVTTFEISLSQGYPVVKLEKHLKDFRLRLGEKDLRFIIPMPGRTTVGLEIPNKNFYNLLFGTLVNSKEFINSQCIMPIALGQKLDNSFCILDLTKMPHLLIAGATGQGKSVCLHAIILSLLFKMKPSELKLILIDPKKVELNAYKRISKAFYFKDDSLRNYQTENEFILQTILDLEYEM
ncbi:MAG TPA: DNA translocase FtsK 4TM domain-containing protein, partial [Sediminibacterium sp.]|uniref:DNA translocase FtsK 4TM domain-containing protein n=1 Tax=Sediminibacterium sp. TaxID=1917865 RepID=UPI002BBBD364